MASSGGPSGSAPEPPLPLQLQLQLQQAPPPPQHQQRSQPQHPQSQQPQSQQPQQPQPQSAAGRGWSVWGHHFRGGSGASSNSNAVAGGAGGAQGRRAVLHRSEITREGWLWARTPAQTWKRRWFVLDSFWLHSFPSNKAAAQASVASQDFLAVFQAQINTYPGHVYAGARDNRKGPAFCFGMVEAENPDYLHVFEADSEEDRASWIEALKLRAAFFIGERGFDQVHPRSIHEGFLSKTGGSNKRFRKRYVVLLSDRLLYFRKKGDPKSAGSVDLSSRSLVKSHEGNLFSVASESHSRHFLFQAGSPEEASAWTQLLRDRVRQLGSPPPAHSRSLADPCQSVPVTPVHRGESRLIPAAAAAAAAAVGPSPSHLRRGSDSAAFSTSLPQQSSAAAAAMDAASHPAGGPPSQLPQLAVMLPPGGAGPGGPSSTTSAGSASRRFIFGRRGSTPAVDSLAMGRAGAPPLPSGGGQRRLQAPAHLPVGPMTPASRSHQHLSQPRTRERSLTADSHLQLHLEVGMPSEIVSLRRSGSRRAGGSADSNLESPLEHAREESRFSVASSPTGAEASQVTREPTEDSLSDSGTGTGEEYLRQVVAGVDVHLGRSMLVDADANLDAAEGCAFPDCDSAAHEGHPYCATHSFLSLSGGFREGGGAGDASSTDTDDSDDSDEDEGDRTSDGEDTPRGFYRGSRSGSLRGNRSTFMHPMARAFEAAYRRGSRFPGGGSGAPSMHGDDESAHGLRPVARMLSSQSESSLNILRTFSGNLAISDIGGGRLERQDEGDEAAGPSPGSLSHSPSIYFPSGGDGGDPAAASRFQVTAQQLGIDPEEAQFMAAIGSQRGQETPTPMLRQRMLEEGSMGSPATAARSVAADNTPPRLLPAAAAAALSTAGTGSSPPQLVGYPLSYGASAAAAGRAPSSSATASVGNRTPQSPPRGLPAEVAGLEGLDLLSGPEPPPPHLWAGAGPGGAGERPFRPRHHKSESMGSRFSAAAPGDPETSSSSTDSLLEEAEEGLIDQGYDESMMMMEAAAGGPADEPEPVGHLAYADAHAGAYADAYDEHRTCFSCDRLFIVGDEIVELVCSSCQQAVCNECCGVSPSVARQGSHAFRCHECDNPLNNLIQMF